MIREQEIAVLRNSIKRVRCERDAARELNTILMRQLARVEREAHELREELRIGISAD